MAAMMLVISGRKVGALVLPGWIKLLGWAAAVLMAGTVSLFAWSSLRDFL
jgi:hypothetical protein